MIELIILGIFLASLSGIVVMISRKVPLLLSLPENLIQESFITKPSKLKNFTLVIRDLFDKQRYESRLVLFLEKALRKIRVWILKSDTLVSKMLTRVQEQGRKDAVRKAQYWGALRDLRDSHNDQGVPDAVDVQPIKNKRMDGIKKIFSRNKNDSNLPV